MTPLLGSKAQNYWQASRSPRYSLVFALPLLLAYEGLAMALPVAETHGVRNGAEMIFFFMFYAVAGAYGPMLFGVLMIGVAAWSIARDVRANGAPSRERNFVFMFLESAALAFVMGLAAATLTSRLVGALHLMASAGPTSMKQLDRPTMIMTSLGAGLFEELLFRVVLVSLLMTLVHLLTGAGRRGSALVVVPLSALIFSAFHYIGPMAWPFTVESFIDRAIGGLLLSLVYVTRGFGIVAWTHALYDLGLILLGVGS